MSRWAACLAFLTLAAAACADSYSLHDRAALDSGVSPDAGALDVPADAGRSFAASDAGAQNTDAMATCALAVSPPLDAEWQSAVRISVHPTSTQEDFVTYHGPVTVDVLEGPVAELTTGSGVRIRWSHAPHPLSVGEELWADIEETRGRFLPTSRLTQYVLRSSQDGEVLAEARHGELRDGGATFLGVPLTFDRLCTMEVQCTAAEVLQATFHADRPLTLTGNRYGYVRIDGVEYKIWLHAANRVRTVVAEPDCPPPPSYLEASAFAVSGRISNESDHQASDDAR